MTEQQQELYDELLKKVNEYCLGAAAEDVIAAIDDLVENYETPKKRSSKTKDQLIVENETYQYMFHGFRYYVESKEFSLEDLAKRIKAIDIINTKQVDVYSFKRCSKYVYLSICNIDRKLASHEYKLLKEILK